MKNNGFTLVELLGVIVILALLVTLVFPAVIGSIKSSSEKTDDLTLKLIYNAADLYTTNHSDEYLKVNGTKYSISLQELVDEGLLASPIKLSDSDSDLTDLKCVQAIYNNGFTFELKNNGSCAIVRKCLAIDGTKTLGSRVKCMANFNEENFYVLSSNNTVTVLLAEYPITYSADIDDLSWPLQNKSNISSSSTSIAFASSPYYWASEQSYPVDVYGADSTPYQHLENYKTIFNSILNSNSQINTISEVRLLNSNDLSLLGCTVSTVHDCTNSPSWFKNSNFFFWTGIAKNASSIEIFDTNTSARISATVPPFATAVGKIRPVVLIDTAAIATALDG